MSPNPSTSLKWSAFVCAVIWTGAMVWSVGPFDLLAVIIFSIDAGTIGVSGFVLNTDLPSIVTVRHDVAGARDSNSFKREFNRWAAIGAARRSGTRRADNTGVATGVDEAGSGAAGARSACSKTETPDRHPSASRIGTT